MVHALREIRRVLVPRGTIIDLRPICVDVPLRIFTAAGWKSAGMVYRGEERGHDVAANRAMRRVVNAGEYAFVKLEYFAYNWYWNTLNELKSDLDGRWKEDLFLSRENWKLARKIFKKGSGANRIMIPIRAKLGVYEKQ